MKKTLFYLSAVALVLATACNKEIAGPEAPAGKTTVSVSLDDQTKTTLADEVAGARKVLWSEGDKIAINGTASEALAIGGTQTAKFSFTSEIADPTAAQPWNVLYPASVYKDAQTITLAATQQIAEGDNIVPDVLPMAKQVTTKEVTLSHVCGILSIQVEGAVEVSELVLTANNGEALSGDFSLDYATCGLTAVEGASNQVKVSILKNLAEGVAFVNVVVPAGTYADGFNVAVTDKEGKSYVKTLSGSKTVAAGHMFVMPAKFGVSVPSYFVTPAGAGSKNGANWENALGYTEMAAMLHDKGAAKGNFYLAKGEYKGGQINLPGNVSIYGGYPDNLTGTLLTGRNLEENITKFTLSSTGGIRLFWIDADNKVLFSGIHVEDITSNWDGAALCSSANHNPEITFKNCVFNNITGAKGGAINIRKGKLTTEYCTFTNCKVNASSGVWGGAVSLGDGGNQVYTAKYCTFENNYGGQFAGALMLNQDSAVATVDHCTFTGNTAASSGAIEAYRGTCNVSNSTFTKNVATGDGGVSHIQNTTSEINFTACEFNANQANGNGGVTATWQGKMSAVNCTFTGNKAKQGGAIYIYNGNEINIAKLSGCTLTGQVTTSNGGVINLAGAKAKAMLNDCVIKDNGVTGGDIWGQLFQLDGGSQLMLYNTTIQDNVANVHGAINGNSNILFANVSMIGGKEPCVRVEKNYDDSGYNGLHQVYVNTILLNNGQGGNAKLLGSVSGNYWGDSKLNVTLKGGCILNGYSCKAAGSQISKTATDFDEVPYADLNVSKNAEGKYVIGNYPAGYQAADAATVESVLKNDFVVSGTNYGQQFYNWLKEINAL